VIRLVVLLEAALITVAVIGYFALPETFQLVGGRPGFLSGPTMKSPYAHSNRLSASGAMVFAYALSCLLAAEQRRGRVGWSAVGVAGTVGMLLAAGRQGMVIWLASAAVVLFFHRRRLFLALIAPLTAIVAVINWDALAEIFQRGQAASTFSTWSGRLVWWSAAFDVWELHPWTGYGFGTGGRFVALREIGVAASSLHSGYVEALVGVGLLGVIPLAYVMIRVARWCLRALRAKEYAVEAILVVPLFLHTLVSLGFGAWLVADVLLFLFLASLSDLHDLQPRKAALDISRRFAPIEP
jgi:O-antigen ligase